MGLLERIEQKAFLGAEFLTWLWLRTECDQAPIELEGEDSVDVAFENTMALEAEYGEATAQTLRGAAPGASAEARAALLEGKIVKRAKLHLTQGEMEWAFTLRGETFDFSAIRVPAPKGLPFDENVSLRMEAVERLFALVDKLYAAFLAIRLDADSWGAELARLRKWAGG
ncbi:MAG: hypothetical protein NTW86_11755 [Candidatus Sumerlaeota bacterium]|nr:hypothetical protein [Candidatus Sumerlaeota bacterium]